MLRSLKDLEHYAIAATDGDIGRVTDFLVEDEQWTVRYLVASTGHFFGGRRVLLSPTSLGHADWLTRTFDVQSTVDQVKHGPSVDVDQPVSHLRGVKELRGYKVRGSDEEIGHVQDFIVDDETWQIRYVVIDTSNSWLGKRVLVAPHWASRVSYDEARIYFHLSCEAIRSSPEFHAHDAINREYEQRLYNYYGLPVYWDMPGSPSTAQPTVHVAPRR